VAYNHWGWQCVKGAQRCDTDTETCEITGDSCKHDTRYWVNDTTGDFELMPDACPPVSDTDTSSDCVSYFKCVDGFCTGGANSGNACDAAEDCPSLAIGDLSGTTCTQMPIDNLSRLQAILIFSNKVNNWREFGPWYPDLPIVQCMRHAGSGTHATLEIGVFRGDANVWDTTIGGASPTWTVLQSTESTDPNGSEPVVWHYESSTDLTEDCLDFYYGAVGYIDADKILGNDTVNSCHEVKFEGVEPTREKVKFGEYSFWAGQKCFWDTGAISTVQANLATALMDFAKDPANLNNVDFGQKANFWATDNEMTVSKSSDAAYPSK
jgi:hypothetical protein